MAKAKFRFCKWREAETPVFKRIWHPPISPGSSGGYTTYETHDGRFEINSIYNRGGPTWQARCTDGSDPFRGFGGKYNSKYYNGDTLDECRDEIGMVYDKEGISNKEDTEA